MKKLTQDDIQFIDTYLKNSDILFDDVRMEMVDHVASDIEEQINNGDDRDFYNVFKDYMIENKKLLQNSNKAFRKATDKKIALELLKQLVSLRTTFIFGIIYLSLVTLQSFLDELYFLKMIKYAPMSIFILGFTTSVIIINRKTAKYSATKRMLVFFGGFYQVFNIIMNPLNLSHTVFMTESLGFSIILITIMITLISVLCITGLKYKREYQIRYKTV